MRKIYPVFAVAMLMLPLSAKAADEVQSTGAIEVEMRAVDNQNNSAKFQEYRDRDDGLDANFYLNTDTKNYFFNLEGQNLGLDDQSYNIKGGDRKNFKYRLHYNETPHNLSFGAKSIYSNPGTNNLTYSATDRAKNTDAAYTPAISTDPNTWSTFDYTVNRKDYGAELDINMGTPYYLNFGANQLETKGMQPLGQPSGVYADRNGAQFSSFGNVIEMPAPVDYKTNDAYAVLGYKSKEIMASLKGSLSSFENENHYLTWRNPYVSTENFTEVSSLAPDNDYWKLAFDGSMNLPMNSLLAVRASHATLQSDFAIPNTIASATSGAPGVSPTYADTVLGVNQTNFDGDVTYTKLGIDLSGSPIRDLFGKIYYNYLEKQNDSTQVTFTNGADSVSNHIFDYDKNNFGLDIDYKLPMKNMASLGYEYLNIDRKRDDAESTSDNKFYVQLKNSTLDNISAKIRYERLERSSDFGEGAAGTGVADAEYVSRFLRRFDATDSSRDTFKLGLEFYPMEHLDFGVEYAYKRTEYDETILGRTEDKAHSLYFDTAWTVPGKISLNGFVGYEKTDNDSSHRNFLTDADPATAATSSNYNWEETLSGDYWVYGLSALVPVIPDTVDFVASFEYQDSDGQATFTRQIAPALSDVDESDDYTRKLVQAKAIYKYAKNMDITLGYVYEKYEYSDAQYNGYTYTVGSPINTYLSGAYADASYEANVGYLIVKYGF